MTSYPVEPAMAGLSHKNRLPLYHQLKGILEDRIGSGEWAPGAQVLSERELCQEFKISRITVRQALSELVMEGRLVRERGRGTFVAQLRIQQSLTRLTGFSQDMQSRGLKPGARVIQVSTVIPPPQVSAILRLGPRESAVLVQRLRLANGEPMAVETAYLPELLCHSLTSANLEDRSLYQLLSEKFGIVPARAEQQLNAAACPAPEGKLLGVRKGSPVLHIFRTTFNSVDQPIEYVESYYRGDKYVFYAHLSHA